MMVTPPTAAQVTAHLGWPSATLPAETTAAVTSAITVASMAARAYTRGRGFATVEDTPKVADDVHSVIVMTAARILANPTNSRRIESGSFNAAPGIFEGWTLAELAILNRYRRRANALAVNEALPAWLLAPEPPNYVELYEHGA